MKLSLHLGLNRVDPNAYNGWPGLLNACENDASGLAAALTDRGFTARLLLNENATISVFSFELSVLAAKAAPGDLVVISFSGHGGQQYSLAEPDGYYETICFSDGQLVNHDFVRLLAQFAPGVNVVVILDCCHAGGDDREMLKPTEPATRCAPASTWLPRPQTQDAIRQTLSASVALFCACREDETASDGDHFGAWTGSLLSALTSSASGLLMQAWFTLAAALCPPTQHPVLEPLGQPGVLNQSIQ